MTNGELRQQVQNALDWEPSVDAGEIGASVDDGVVTLWGDVGTYAEKSAAETAALGVYGVRAVANDITVRLRSDYERTDTEIARAAAAALKWSHIPTDRVTPTVSKGWLTLTGRLDWQYQKADAERAVRGLTGVKGVTNLITLKPQGAQPADIEAQIEAAFRRSAEIDARHVRVIAEDGHIILSGNVRSWAEREEAERVARAAPGVTQVDDRITVTP